MKLEGTNKYTIKNISKGKIIIGVLALEHDDTYDIIPAFVSNESKKEIEFYILSGQMEISVADVEVKTTKEPSDVVNVETVKNEHGDKNQHVVYDPSTASKNRAIAVEPIDISKAIETETNKVDLINFLERHWKTIEKDLASISDINRLNKLLIVADELGIKEGNKKLELIKNRIKELK